MEEPLPPLPGRKVASIASIQHTWANNEEKRLVKLDLKKKARRSRTYVGDFELTFGHLPRR